MHTLLRQVPSHHDWFNASLGRAQHTSIRSSRHCAKPGSPIGGVGDALMESAVGLNKSVLVDQHSIGTRRAELEQETTSWARWCITARPIRQSSTKPPLLLRAMPRSRGDLGRVAGTESLQQYRDGLHRFNQN